MKSTKLILGLLLACGFSFTTFAQEKTRTQKPVRITSEQASQAQQKKSVKPYKVEQAQQTPKNQNGSVKVIDSNEKPAKGESLKKMESLHNGKRESANSNNHSYSAQKQNWTANADKNSEEVINRAVQNLDHRVHLTDVQKAKAKEIYQNFYDKSKSIVTDAKLSQDEKVNQMKATEKNVKEQIYGLLDGAQKKLMGNANNEGHIQTRSVRSK